jgi:hypothetical protein
MIPDEQLQKLLANLRSKNGPERGQARKALVRMGGPAVEPLIGLLSDRDEHVRWEVCKALGSIADPRSAAPLVDELRDESFEIQWLAAEGLIALGEKAVVPLLRALEIHFKSVHVRQGAHHILHALERSGSLNKETIAVLDALRFLEPKSSVGVAARLALDSLDDGTQ